MLGIAPASPTSWDLGPISIYIRFGVGGTLNSMKERETKQKMKKKNAYKCTLLGLGSVLTVPADRAGTEFFIYCRYRVPVVPTV